MMLGKFIAFLKAAIILLKLILIFLKKRHKDHHQPENNNDSGFGSPTTSSNTDEKFDVSSELDAEINRLRIENKALRDIISKENLIPQSDVSRNVVTRMYSRRRSSLTDVSRHPDVVTSTPRSSTSDVSSRRRSSLTDVSRHPDVVTSTPRSSTSDVSIHDVVCQKLMLKLQQEREENDRLQNYINDVMYMVLENEQWLLQK